MADREQKTFPALPRRRQQAREEGKIARSQDLTAAVSFFLASLTVAMLAPVAGRAVVGAFRAATAAAVQDLPKATMRAMAWPCAAAVIAAVALSLFSAVGTVVQGGLMVVPGKLAPDFSRMSLARYFGRVFSLATVMEVLKGTAKIALVVLFAWMAAERALLAYRATGNVAGGLSILHANLSRLLGWSAAIALAAGVGDYLYKHHEHETELMMTRQEFLEALKQEEVNPQVKRALRRAARRNFQRTRGIHQVATATVVVTNPTHFAVALRYRRGFDKAPLVVAKGANEGALKLIALARLSAVPVLENKLLARALYPVAEVGDFIPRQFYRAIAEVLALVMRAQSQAQAVRTA